MPANIEHKFVEANGVSFDVAFSGATDATPVLCLHGFPEGSMSWEPVMERLAPQDARIYVPDLRGYPNSGRPDHGYDVFTLSDDVAGLIKALGLDRPVLVGHDWGGELGWIFAHRYSHLIRKLVIVNGTHPKTLVRAVYRCQDFQGLRIFFVAIFAVPWIPEILLTTALGRRVLKLSFTLRGGTKGTMNVPLIDKLVARFQRAIDLHWPIAWYRSMILTQLLPWRLARLNTVYKTPITVPVTAIWGLEDGALPYKVALGSGKDAGCAIDWRPLEGINHFVSLEAPDTLAMELKRAVAAA